MKLIRYGNPGRERPGVILPDGASIDCAAFLEDWNEAFFATDGLPRLATWLKGPGRRAPKIPTGVRLGPPIARPSKIICIGLNFRDHAEEVGAKIPDEPVLFFKSTTAIVGPNDDVLVPRESTKLDFEVELAVVIGKTARYLSADQVLGHLAGYLLHNDYSERHFQLERSGQWAKGKGCDTFAPLGPWLATPDEIANPGDLGMWLTVNGEMRQKSRSSQMAFDVPFLVSYVSQFMTLLPGDVISTGTPAGCGIGQKPPRYLQPGDVVVCGIDGLGESRQIVRVSS